jgi:hypothetical protein
MINYICSEMAVSRILVFVILIVLAASCFGEPDCIITATSTIKIDFKQNKINPTTKVKSVVDTALIFTSIWVSDIDTAYLQNKQLSTVTLPLNPNKKLVTYTFNIRSSSGIRKRTDSIKFSFASESRVIGPACGAFTYFLDLKVTATNYDSLQYTIVNTRMLKNTSNAQVFY